MYTIAYILVVCGLLSSELSGMELLRKWWNQPHTWLISHGFGDPGNKNNETGKSPFEQLPRDIFKAMVTPQCEQDKNLLTSLHIIQKLSCVSKKLRSVMEAEDIAKIKNDGLQRIADLKQKLILAIQDKNESVVDRMLAEGLAPYICDCRAETFITWIKHYLYASQDSIIRKLIATYSEDQLIKLRGDINQNDYDRQIINFSLFLIEWRLRTLQREKTMHTLLYEGLRNSIYKLKNIF